MDIRQEVMSRKDDLIKDIIDFVSIKSVLDTKTIDYKNPFGKGVSNALNHIYQVALKDGFKATNYDNYCVEIEYGVGDELIMILGHADVVPEGTGWTKCPPYSPKIIDNILYGRGVLDDKGPVVCAYYALKILKDNGIMPNKTIRLVVGGNEENGSECLEYYFHTIKRPQPDYGFTPDANFPLIYGEKGIMTYEYFGNIEDKYIEEFEGGEVFNAVAASFNVTFKEKYEFIDNLIKDLKEAKLKVSKEEFDNKVRLSIIGKSSHGSMPENGINAISNTLVCMQKYLKDSTLVNHFAPKLESCFGEGLGVYTDIEPWGHLTVNLGLASYKNNEYCFNINIRFPSNWTGETLKDKLDESKLHNSRVLGSVEPLFIPIDTPFIKVLLDAYYSEVKTDKKPFTIGGGTYAKEAKNTVAFGMEFDRNNGTGGMHELDEAINIDDLIDGTVIYTKALLGLIEL